MSPVALGNMWDNHLWNSLLSPFADTITALKSFSASDWKWPCFGWVPLPDNELCLHYFLLLMLLWLPCNLATKTNCIKMFLYNTTFCLSFSHFSLFHLPPGSRKCVIKPTWPSGSTLTSSSTCSPWCWALACLSCSLLMTLPTLGRRWPWRKANR